MKVAVSPSLEGRWRVAVVDESVLAVARQQATKLAMLNLSNETVCNRANRLWELGDAQGMRLKSFVVGKAVWTWV